MNFRSKQHVHALHRLHSIFLSQLAVIDHFVADALAAFQVQLEKAAAYSHRRRGPAKKVSRILK